MLIVIGHNSFLNPVGHRVQSHVCRLYYVNINFLRIFLKHNKWGAIMYISPRVSARKQSSNSKNISFFGITGFKALVSWFISRTAESSKTKCSLFILVHCSAPLWLYLVVAHSLLHLFHLLVIYFVESSCDLCPFSFGQTPSLMTVIIKAWQR